MFTRKHFGRCVGQRRQFSIVLGHKSIKTTEKYYAQRVQSRQNAREEEVKNVGMSIRWWERFNSIIVKTKIELSLLNEGVRASHG